MTQATLPQFKPEFKRIQDHFNGNGQAYAIAERLLRDKGNFVKKFRLKRAIKKMCEQEAGNFSARMHDAKIIVKEFGMMIEWNRIKNEKHSAYKIFEMDVGLPEKVM
jgi:hypothetical protein